MIAYLSGWRNCKRPIERGSTPLVPCGTPIGKRASNKLRPRPSLTRIIETAAEHFGLDPSDWQPGRRVDNAGRAVAAYLVRRRFGYSAREVADALGYRSHGGVTTALARIESASPQLKRTVNKLANSLH